MLFVAGTFNVIFDTVFVYGELVTNFGQPVQGGKLYVTALMHLNTQALRRLVVIGVCRFSVVV